MSYLHVTLPYHTRKTFYDPMLSYFLLKFDENEKLSNHEKSGVGNNWSGVGNNCKSGVGNKWSGVGNKWKSGVGNKWGGVGNKWKSGVGNKWGGVGNKLNFFQMWSG